MRATFEDQLRQQFHELRLQQEEDNIHFAVELDNAQAQVDPEHEQPQDRAAARAAARDAGAIHHPVPSGVSEAVGRQLVRQAEALLPPVPLTTPAEQAMMVGGQEQAPQQEQPQAQAQVQPQEMGPVAQAQGQIVQQLNVQWAQWHRREQHNVQPQAQAQVQLQEMAEVAQAVHALADLDVQAQIVRQIL